MTIPELLENAHNAQREWQWRWDHLDDEPYRNYIHDVEVALSALINRKDILTEEQWNQAGEAFGKLADQRYQGATA